MKARDAPRPWPPVSAPRPPRDPRPTGLPVHVVLFGDPQWDLVDFEPLAHLVFHLAVQEPETLACCLLPRRFDWLLATGLGLTAKVQELAGTARHAARRLGIHRELWQESFEARILARGEAAATARTITERPRAEGLVTAAAQWLYQMRRL